MTEKAFKYYPKYVIPAGTEAKPLAYYKACIRNANAKGWLKQYTAESIAKDEKVHITIRQAYQEFLDASKFTEADVDAAEHSTELRADDHIQREAPSGREPSYELRLLQETRDEIEDILNMKRIPKEVRRRLQLLLPENG